MKTFVDGIAAAEKTGTKAEKRQLLANLSKDGQRLVMEALSPDRVFNVKKFDDPDRHPASDAPAAHFFDLLDRLHDRQLTGNAAKEAVTRTLCLYTRHTATYLKRVLKKDLKVGMSDETFNKIYPNLVPTYPIMLAEKVDEKTKWVFPKLLELKYDGQRVTCFVTDKGVKYQARGGGDASNLCGTEFEAELQQMRTSLGWSGMVVDGEVLQRKTASANSTIDFSGTMKAKKAGSDKSHIYYAAFDMMSLKDWNKRSCPHIQVDRSAFLEKTIKGLKLSRIEKSIYKLVNSKTEAVLWYDEVCKAGEEGLIVKDPNGMYEWDRSKFWLKWKPVIDVDLEIVGFYAGKPDSRLKDTLGGCMFEGKDENGNFIRVNVGGGFTDEMRHEIWNNKGKYLAKIGKIEAKSISKAENATHFSLREPVFIEIRWDKKS